MKIAFDGRVLTHKHFTGVENYAQTIYEKLNQDNITLFKPKTTNKILRHLWEHTVLPFKVRKFDLLFAPANIAPIWKPKGVKLVVTLHDSAYLTYPKSISKLFYYYYLHAIPRILKISDRVITISEFSKDEIVKHYPFAKDKIRVIYNGIDSDKFYPMDSTDRENYILFVGSLNPRKNIIRLIKAFKEVSKNRDIKLKIVGKFSDIFSLDKEEQDIFKTARRHKKIEFLEDVDDKELVKLYQKALMFVFPSTYEGFGLPPLEAMACGVPVVVSDISVLREVCGDGVLYVNPYDIDDIARKIGKLLSDEVLQKELIEKGLKRVKQFSWQNSAKEHLRVFEEVLK